MKKFGLGKKDSKTKSAANNPYAQPSVPADPYTQAKTNAGIVPTSQHDGGPRPSSSVRTGLPSGPSMKKAYGNSNSSSSLPGSYGDTKPAGKVSGGYGNDKYGNPAGYGQDKFDGNTYGGGSSAGGNSKHGAGGYGGLGPVDGDSASVDANRDELFGGAPNRMQQPGRNGYDNPPPYGAGAGQGESHDRGYGAYGDRQLTAEEEEQEDIDVTKQEIKNMKQQDVSATRNALRAAALAEETGRNTLARLGAQGERLHNADRNLDLSTHHQTVAEEKAKELKIANRSMFRMHVDNPFTKGSRRDQEILDKHREERDQRESTRQAAFRSEQRMNDKFKGLGAAGPKSQSTLAERAKYQFEADSEDDEMENEIENNVDQLGEATSRLGLLAKAQGDEVRQQNRLLEQLATKTDTVDDHIAVNRRRLDQIR